MGKIAEPGVNYCDGEGTASLSVNGQIYSTENPPISYTLSGNVATISDALGVIATVSLGGGLIASDTQQATAKVQYCTDLPMAQLSWRGGTVTTENPWIQYEIIPLGTDVASVAVPGNTYVFNPSGYILDPEKKYTIRCAGTIQFGGGRLFDGQYAEAILGEPWVSSYTIDPPRPQMFESQGFSGNLLDDAALPYNESHIYEGKKVLTPTSAIEWAVRHTDDNPSDNSGSLFVQLIEVTQYNLIVRDKDNELLNIIIPSESIDARVTCYDYDISEVSYACTGCPSGTLFECTCPATNTKYCYGFDPDNPDVFKPLFESPIA